MSENVATFRGRIVALLRRLEKITRTDNVYLAKGLATIGGSQVFSLISGLIQYTIIARVVPPEAYGSYKYLVSMFELAAVCSLTGMKVALIRSTSRGFTGSLTEAFQTRLRSGYLFGLPFLGLSVWSLLHGQQLYGFGYAAIYVLAPLIYAGSSYVSYLQGTHAFGVLSKWSVIQEVALFVTVLSAALFTGRSVFLFLAYLATMSVNILAFIVTSRKAKEGPRDPELRSHALHQSGLDIFQTVAGQIDSALLFYFLGPVQVAMYSFAELTADQMRSVFSSLYTVASPRLSSRSIEEIMPTFFRKLFLLSFLGALAAAAYGLVAPFIYQLLFPAYVSVVHLSQLYAWSLMFVLPSLLGATLLNLQNARREATMYNIATYATLIVLICIGGAWRGVEGVIWARILGAACQLGIVVTLLMRLRKRSAHNA